MISCSCLLWYGRLQMGSSMAAYHESHALALSLTWLIGPFTIP